MHDHWVMRHCNNYTHPCEEMNHRKGSLTTFIMYLFLNKFAYA